MAAPETSSPSRIILLINGLRVGLGSSTVAFSAVEQSVATFGSARPHSLSYVDEDGDVITVTNQSELDIALKTFQTVTLRAFDLEAAPSEDYEFIDSASQFDEMGFDKAVEDRADAAEKMLESALLETKRNNAVVDEAVEEEIDEAPVEECDPGQTDSFEEQCPASSLSPILEWTPSPASDADLLRLTLASPYVAEALLALCDASHRPNLVRHFGTLAAVAKKHPYLETLFGNALTDNPFESSGPIWPNVVCDGCSSDTVAASASEAARTRDSRTGRLIGIRWKSATIKDFDLCATCERTGKFSNFEPFLKLTSLDKVPASVTVVLPPVGFENVSVDGEVGVRRSSKSCPNNHSLVAFATVSKAFSCDVCGRRMEQGEQARGCRACDWDVCDHCFGKAAEAAASSSPRSNDDSPKMEWVADTSLKDGTEVRRGSFNVKRWIVRNRDQNIPWPESTTLVFVGGNTLGVDVETPIGSVAPDSCTEIGVPMTVPIDDDGGRSIAYFRLGYDRPDGSRVFFGDRLWIDVSVRSKRLPDSLHPRAYGIAKWQSQLGALARLGFYKDVVRCLALLEEHEGDVEKVVSRLKAENY